MERDKFKVKILEVQRQLGALRGKYDLLKIDHEELKKQAVVLNDQLVIARKDSQHLGRRQAPHDHDEYLLIEEAVTRRIKKRRKNGDHEWKEPTL